MYRSGLDVPTTKIRNRFWREHKTCNRRGVWREHPNFRVLLPPDPGNVEEHQETWIGWQIPVGRKLPSTLWTAWCFGFLAMWGRRIGVSFAVFVFHFLHFIFGILFIICCIFGNIFVYLVIPFFRVSDQNTCDGPVVPFRTSLNVATTSSGWSIVTMGECTVYFTEFEYE